MILLEVQLVELQLTIVVMRWVVTRRAEKY